MFPKEIASLLIGSIVLMTVAPSETFSQTRFKTETAAAKEAFHVAAARSKPDLKAAFASEAARIKAHAFTEADSRSIEKGRQQSPTAANTRHSWTQSDKIIFIGFLIGTTGLVILLIKKGKVPQDCDKANPADPVTCQILFGN
jgi:hypothetical protein